MCTTHGVCARVHAERAWYFTMQVFVAVDGEAVGVVSLADTVRSDAAATIVQLQRQGLQTILLTGGPS